MKKKILFVMETLRIGGAEKSLITILSMLDYEKFDVDLFLFNHSGEFLNQLPKQVNLLPEDEKSKPMRQSFKNAWLKYLSKGDLKRSLHSFCWLVGCTFNRLFGGGKEYYGWSHKKKIYSPLSGEYAAAVAFLEKGTTYYVADMVNAKRKIAFMHTDYEAIPHNEKLDACAYKKFDNLAAVSAHTADTMVKHFPFMDGKVKVIKNMVSPELIHKMANEPAPELENCSAKVKIVTVGRLTPPKKIDGAIEMLSNLRKIGVDVQWFAVGDGESREALEKQIADEGLKGKFHLLGSRANPYPYMKACDIYAQPSRWEGFGITVAEAKALNKPIVTSDIPEFQEQIQHGVTGVIAKDDDDFVKILADLSANPEKRTALSQNLKALKTDNTELKKLNDLLENS